MNNIVDLTSKLISIPSYVDDDVDESKIADYTYKYLEKNTSLKLEKQFLSNTNRFNIFATNSPEVNLLLIGHMDTVPASLNWTKDPFIPTIEDNRLYGLGSSDMKGGLAAILLQAKNGLPANTGLLFYLDEEYDFAGILEFIKKYPNLRPKKIISLDGSDLKLQNACRGIIEAIFTVKGVSGHAAKTNSPSVNAIDISYQAILALRRLLLKYTSPLGPSSLNLASVEAGLETNPNQIWKQSGNMVADICRFTLDIRPSNTNLNSKIVIDTIKKSISSLGGKLVDTTVRFSFNSWYTDPKLINSDLPLIDASQLGYMDIQMLWQQYKKPICLSIGAADINKAHSPDEYINLDKLKQLPKILNNLILNVKLYP